MTNIRMPWLREAVAAGAWSVALLAASAAPAVAQPSSLWQPYRQADSAVAPAAAASSAPLPAETVASDAGPTARMAQVPFDAAGYPVMLPQQAIGGPMCEPCPPGVMDASGGIIAPGLGQAWLVDPSDPGLWQWRVLPGGVVWQSYWAGAKESRMSGTVFDDRGDSTLDVTLGGRAALLRYGTDGPGRPLGWELQIEGAGQPRLNLDHNWDVDATDFRFGLPLVYGREAWQAKFSYYHLSSHMGDEFAIREDALDQRINYVRDALAIAGAWIPHPAWRLYSEAAWAFHYDGGAEPWELQFGVDVAEPGPTGIGGTPFVAVNGHLQQEHDFGGNVVAQAGWLWRGTNTSTMRTGFHYFNGKSNQFEFFDRFEEQIGGGIWYDF